MKVMLTHHQTENAVSQSDKKNKKRYFSQVAESRLCKSVSCVYSDLSRALNLWRSVG